MVAQGWRPGGALVAQGWRKGGATEFLQRLQRNYCLVAPWRKMAQDGANYSYMT